MNFTHVFAVPGGHSIIDVVDPTTGKSNINKETLEQVQSRYPGAQLILWEDWRAARAAEQDTPISWIATTPASYNEMLNVLPPLDWNERGFLVGEATDHSISTGQPRYTAYRHLAPHVYAVSSRPLTRKEWKEVTKA